jgi:hypothetical protein
LIGQFYTDDDLGNWFRQIGLPLARKMLSNFGLLDELFSSFKDYEEKKYEKINNAILHLCLPEFDGKPRQGSMERLREIEEALSAIDLPRWKNDKRNSLRSRLCDDNYDRSFSLVTEITIAKRFIDKFGKDRVKVYPKLATRRFSDVLVSVNSKQVYMEIGNLGVSLPEEKISRILNAAARYLGSKLEKRPHFFLLNLDTARFVLDKEGRINEAESYKKIVSEIDKLNIDKLIGFNGFLVLENLSRIIANQEILEKMSSLLPFYDRKDLELIKTSPVKEWVESCRDQIVRSNGLAKSIGVGNFKSLLVEIHSEMFHPSASSKAETESFIGHVVRHIKTQIAEKQLQPGSPNIIIMQGYNWIIFGFDDLLDIQPLYSKVAEFLTQNKEEWLSGVAIFAQDFAKSIFIPNEQASKEAKLSKAEIEKLGMRYISNEGELT